MSRRYKEGIHRHQEALLPPRVEDYVGVNNTVRAIDAYVATLDLGAMGFQHAAGELTAGQPAFHPGKLLALYIFGYLDRVHSSRRLARECRRNLEVMWLMEGLTPGYRTIAEFRKVNGDALKRVCRDFVALCKELDLLGDEVVAIDGSFFKANASKASVTTKKQLEERLKQIERDIDAFCKQMDETDVEERNRGELGEDQALGEKLKKLKERQERTKRKLEELEASGETQLSTTDQDARSLTKSGKNLTGYNVQIATGSRHRLIVHHEVTNAGNDEQQLARQGEAAKEVLGVETLDVVADAGFYSEQQLIACDAAGLNVYVPIPDKHKAVMADGRLSGASFVYIAATDVYVCPAGQLLHQQGKPSKNHRGVLRNRYTRPVSGCTGCPLATLCLPASGRQRQLYRSEHASRVEAHRRRMKEVGNAPMRQRAGMVEHPFGTLKRWFGWDHFLVRRFKKVRGEMSLMVLGYNLVRVLNILGIEAFREHCAGIAAGSRKPALAGAGA